MPRDVDPKILLEEEVVKWKALVHPSIHRILGYAVIQGIPHVITKWNANGNARDYLRRELSLGTTVDDRVAKASRPHLMNHANAHHPLPVGTDSDRDFLPSSAEPVSCTCEPEDGMPFPLFYLLSFRLALDANLKLTRRDLTGKHIDRRVGQPSNHGCRNFRLFSQASAVNLR